MEQTKLSTRFVISAFALAAVSCAANTSDDSASAGAGNSSSAGTASTTGGATGASGAPSGASGSVGVSGSSAGGAPSTNGGTSSVGGGSTGGACSATIDPADLISDFETGKAQEVVVGGRSGDWFVFNDGSGMQTPVKVVNTPLPAEMGGACGSMYAFHSTATGFTGFGAGFGTDFVAKAAGATAPPSNAHCSAAARWI